ncbi:MAG: DNA repair protein RadA [Phycisphaeraceae bacterium]|nr:DNA repair protein RadA [Phycisphaeraceae bacterium]
MARSTHQFICRSCGALHPRWIGKCNECGQWDCLDEYEVDPGRTQDRQLGVAESARGGGETATVAMPITEVAPTDQLRLPTGIGELDRVLGTSGEGDEGRVGGVVPGSTVLIGGDPGIGKSTLMLQAAGRLAGSGLRVLYATSEESVQQTHLRAQRLSVADDALFVLADTNLARIVEQIRQTEPALVIIDSVQMIYKGDLQAGPGTAAQLRACCTDLVYLAKTAGVAVLLVGHVTKDGQLAGPRLLEHMVDTVLYFEGDRYHSHRVLRAMKNRYGTTLEVGLFEMTDRGLQEVENGAGLLAAEYQPHNGSVVCPVLQGSRCLLLEIQALTATGFPGSAKRRTSGLDGNRLAMLIAVLEKRGGLRLADQDIFASSVGGLKVSDPAADLAIALAIAGTHLNRTLPPGTCAIGEIGLGGEVRHVHQMPQRFAEAARLGFRQIICPPSRATRDGADHVTTVASMAQALELLD